MLIYWLFVSFFFLYASTIIDTYENCSINLMSLIVKCYSWVKLTSISNSPQCAFFYPLKF